MNLPSDPPSARRSSGEVHSQARAKPRAPRIPFGGLVPTGSPFGWTARERSLHVQFLTALLMVIIGSSFVLLDGWPFLLERPEDAAALRLTKILAVGALAFWIVLYVWTWRRDVRRENHVSQLLFLTIAAHIVTATAVCYAIGLHTAASGLIMVASLMLGMVFLERRSLGLAVIGWFASILTIHLVSKAGALPFRALLPASLGPSEPAEVAAERAFAAALIYIPLAVVMSHLIGVWRRDELILHEAAQLDSLTGAYTRGFAMVVMQRAVLKARGDGKPLAVLMLDLDHFKRINDAHGHACGDLVLRQTTQAMQSTLRAGDIVGRFGGEEFVVLLPGTDLKQAVGAAERCRAAVERMRIAEAPYVSVTASVGVAAFPDHADDLDGLLKAADDAMYAAKAKGRNRTEPARARDLTSGLVV